MDVPQSLTSPTLQSLRRYAYETYSVISSYQLGHCFSALYFYASFRRRAILNANGLNLNALLLFAAVMGFGGAFISWPFLNGWQNPWVWP